MVMNAERNCSGAFVYFIRLSYRNALGLNYAFHSLTCVYFIPFVSLNIQQVMLDRPAEFMLMLMESVRWGS